MPVSPQQLREMQDRLARNSKPPPTTAALPLTLAGETPGARKSKSGVTDELQLHDDIIKYCRSQWPPWIYIHANPSQPSCIQTGAADFPIIYLPNNKFLVIECKSVDGKWRPEQLAFKKQLELLGHTVHDIRSIGEFVALIKTTCPVAMKS